MKTKTMRLHQISQSVLFILLLVSLSFLLSSCAVLRKFKSSSIDEKKVEVINPATSVVPESTTAPAQSGVSSGSDQVPEKIESNQFPFQVSLDGTVKKVELNFSQLSVETVDVDQANLKKVIKRKKSQDSSEEVLSVRVLLVRGATTSCRIGVQKVTSDGTIKLHSVENSISETKSLSGLFKSRSPASVLPASADCEYKVELLAKNPALDFPSLNIRADRADVLIERWTSPIDVQAKWGDLNFGAVATLKVNCRYCVLSGDGVEGPVEFEIENGNVGLTGLKQKVTGKTAGDTILTWGKIHANLKDIPVKLQSQSGDVFLFFPSGSHVSSEVKAAKGDVDVKLAESSTFGIPIYVSAEMGNVKILPAPKPIDLNAEVKE